MFGLLTELGPLLLNDASLNTDSYRDTDIPTFLYNPYSWNRLGHLLSFDQPAPVGFSYCNTMQDHTMHPHSCGGIAWTDELTAENAYRALLAFYDKFPCLQSKSLFLTGESYAGIYIPTLARKIVQNNQQISPTDTITTATTIPLEGFAVGDGCLGTQTGICGVLGDNPDGFDVWNILFLAGHGQIPMSTFREVMHACVQSPPDDHDNNDHADDTDWAQLFLRGMGSHRDTMKLLKMNDSACQAALKKVDDQAGGVYAYGLYDECTYRNGMMLKSGVNDYACGGDLVMTDYLNRHDVQDALHVQSDFYSVDNAAGDFNYTPTEPDLTGFYKEMNGKLRILVYNGDTDPAINSFAAQNWTSHLGLEEVESWRPWTVDGCRRMGGYVTRYVGGFEFLTIRGAGHMVPTIKPAAAFTLIKAWIQGSPYPAYDKDCKKPSDRQRNDQVSLDEKNHRAQPIE
jgi:carboxypeptidase C (cathepsin A)